ncbi:MAG: hypothetical protein R3C02_05405 [Planctomycetaceae bacterium]
MEPLAAIAWQERATGDVSAASQTTTEAFDAATDFPSVGRAAPAAAAAAAAVLLPMAGSRMPVEVFRRLNRDDDKALTRERVAALAQITDDLEMFDIDRILRYSSMELWRSIHSLRRTATAIARTAIGSRRPNWAMKAANVAVQEDCMSAIAVIAGRHQAATGDDRGPSRSKQRQKLCRRRDKVVSLSEPPLDT